MDLQDYVKSLKEHTEIIIDKALKAGVDKAFVSASYANTTKIGYEKNDFNIASTHEGTGFSITVHKDQKSGAASINTIDPEKIDKAISDAMQMAECTIADPYIDIAPKSEYENIEPQYSEGIAEITMKEMRQKAQFMLEPLIQNEKICIDSASIDKTLGVRVIGNSNGMIADDYSSALSWSLMGMANEGDEITSFDYISDFSYEPKGLENKIKSSVVKFRTKLLSCLGAKNCESFQGKLLLSPALVEELLIDPMIYHISGSNIMDGKSRWENHLGKKVCHENIHIEDRPFDRNLRGCTAFSSEGIPTSNMTIVDRGELVTHLDSVYSSKKRNVKPTGNGAGPHCAWIAPGKHNLVELLSEQSEYVLEPGRFSGNIDSITGDFSGIAKGSHLFKNGENTGPVKEVMISGNVFDIIQNEVLFSKKQESEGGFFWIPWAVVDGISVISS
jgi:PmbA protein